MSTGRTYGGESAADRAARRRRQLLDAGLELFGTTGYRQATVRQVCSQARVTDRYFYEQFSGTEDLLVAVYTECVERLERAAVRAVGALGQTDHQVLALARTGLDAFLGVVEDDPRLARVVWFEVLGVSPRVEELYLGWMRRFGDLLVSLAGERVARAEIEDAELRVLSDAAVGGISQAVVTWTTSGFAVPRGRLVTALAAFLDGAATPFLRG